MEQADDFEMAVHDLIKEYAIQHQRIVFNGNGYSEEWVEEAKRRGLPNIKSMVESIDEMVSDKAVKVFEKFGVFTKAELESRAEIKYEAYAKALNIEARSMIDIASKHIIPAVIRYTKELAETVNAVREAGADYEVQADILHKVSRLLKEAKTALEKLEIVTYQAVDKQEGKEQAFWFYEEVSPAMEALRKPVDELEMIVAKDMWPMPSYGDLIFEV